MNQKKFELKDVMVTAFNLYRDNFSLFFKINGLGVLILFITSHFMDLGDMTGNIGINLLIQLIGLVVAYAGIYYNIKLGITLIIAIKERYYCRSITIKESYKQAKNCTWRVIGAVLILGLMIIIPTYIFTIGFSATQQLFSKIVAILVGGIPTMYLVVTFGFSIMIRALNPEIRNFLMYSKQLVVNHFWEVFIIYLIPTIIQSPMYVLKNLLPPINLGTVGTYLFSHLGQFIALFTGPFTLGVVVITYLKLHQASE